MFIGFVKFGTYKDIYFIRKKLFKSKMIRINLEQIAINEFLTNFTYTFISHRMFGLFFTPRSKAYSSTTNLLF